jgi:hypothetical protein
LTTCKRKRNTVKRSKRVREVKLYVTLSHAGLTPGNVGYK